MCRNTSEIIPIYYTCDGYAHCSLRDEEYACKHTCHNSSQYEDFHTLCFKCKNSKYVPITLINNGMSDCPLNDDETSYPTQKRIVPNVKELPTTESCIYDRNSNQHGTSHCLFYECPYHFKCSNTFCIPLQYVCDNVYDCPEGDDEIQSFCYDVTCHHMFKCVKGTHCLHPDKVCDGFKDCSDDTYSGEDESFCKAEVCHAGCYCHGHA